jgi:hypothetical protein
VAEVMLLAVGVAVAVRLKGLVFIL